MERLAAEPEPQTSEGHRLICGDCLTMLPTLEAGSVDVVVTSPPYNLGLAYRGYDDRRDEDDVPFMARTSCCPDTPSYEARWVILPQHFRIEQHTMGAIRADREAPISIHAAEPHRLDQVYCYKR